VPAPIINRFDATRAVSIPLGQQVALPFIWVFAKVYCGPPLATGPFALRLTSADGLSQFVFRSGMAGFGPSNCGTPDLPFGRLSIGPFGEVEPPRPNSVLMALPLTGTDGAQSGRWPTLLLAEGACLTLIGLLLYQRSRHDCEV